MNYDARLSFTSNTIVKKHLGNGTTEDKLYYFESFIHVPSSWKSRASSLAELTSSEGRKETFLYDYEILSPHWSDLLRKQHC